MTLWYCVCSVVLGDEIASGAVGTVYLGTVRGEERAIKVILCVRCLSCTSLAIATHESSHCHHTHCCVAGVILWSSTLSLTWCMRFWCRGC